MMMMGILCLSVVSKNESKNLVANYKMNSSC